jgi:type VI secretion system Hcp family effector
METARDENIIGTHTRSLATVFAFAAIAFAGIFYLQRFKSSSPISVAHAATSDYLLTIDGVSGDIHVESFSWGVSSPRDVSTGMATGRRQYQPLVIKKTVDKSSPLLFKLEEGGKSIKTAAITLTSPDGTQSKVNFQDLSISSFQQQGDMGSPPEDTISFTYQKITF